jgi:hypothetical protein
MGRMAVEGVLYIMEQSTYLSDAELASLAVVGSGFYHDPISVDHATQLLDLRLIYNLLGSFRITTAGQLVLRSDH